MKYYLRLAKLAMRDPRKLPSMYRLKMSKRDSLYSNPNFRVDEVKPPLVIAVRLSYSCNLRCVMCNQWGENGVFIKTPNRQVKREMTTDDFKKFFDDVSEFQPYIYFTGGEPLMNKDIVELINYASSKHMITSMSTNSTFLKKRADEIINSKLDYLYTSLDTPGETSESIVRVNAKGGDSHSEAADAIRHIIELRDKKGTGLPIIQTQTIIVEENQDRIYEMAEFVENVLKPDVWGLQLCVFTNSELNDETTQLYEKEFSQDQVGWSGFIREFEGLKPGVIEAELKKLSSRKWKFKFRPYKPLGMPGFNLSEYFFEPEKPSTTEDLKCMNPYVFAQLQPNGDIAFCGSQPDYVAGNVKESSFMDIWNGENSQSWRKFLNREHFASCKRCFTLHEFTHFRT